MTDPTIPIFFEEEDQDTADLIHEAALSTLRLIDELWRLHPPVDWSLVVLTSPDDFLKYGPTGLLRWIARFFQHRWRPRAEAFWPSIDGWVQRFGPRIMVGVKPMRLISLDEPNVGDGFFRPVTSPEERVRRVTCLQTTQAALAHLGLPPWLYEGIPMLTVDAFAGEETVHPETIDYLEDHLGEASITLMTQYARSYWRTRFLHETRLGMLPSILREPQPRPVLRERLIQAFGGSLWEEADAAVVERFKGLRPKPQDPDENVPTNNL